MALQPAQQLYQWLENEFSPLKLAPEIQRYLEAVKALDKIEYTQYIEALQQVAALKILKQVRDSCVGLGSALKHADFRFRKFIDRFR